MSEVLGDARLSRMNWARNERIRQRTIERVLREWRSRRLDDRTVDRTVEIVLSSQRAIVAQTDAYVSTSAALATGTTPQPLGLTAGPLIGRAGRGGRFLEDVYGGIVTTAREDSFQRGVALARKAITTDAQLAHRNAVQARLGVDRRVVGWKRQINPVGGGETCGLCVAASTQRYSRQALLPLHPMCRCSVVPIYSTDPLPDSGPFDRARLDEVYARAGSTSREDLGRVRFSAEDLPPGIDSDAIAALEPRVALHPEFGLYLTGNRHDTVFSLT